MRSSPSGAAATQGDARVIVKFRAGGSLSGNAHALSADARGLAQNAGALSARLGLALRDGRPIDARSQLVFASGISSAALAQRLAAQPDVEYAVVDERKRALSVPNDPLFPASASNAPAAGQWYLRSSSSNTPAAINADTAWDVTTGHSSVVVAVLDSGIRPEHPDLAGKILPGYDFIHDVGTANDGDARDADPSDPGDGVTQADVSGPSAVDGCTSADIGPSSWHGTQTSGLIGATTNNGVGMASVGHDIRILPVRVLGKCGGYDSDIIDAMRWAAGLPVTGVATNPNPAKVLNMSLGSASSCSAAYASAIADVTAAGVVVVAAAGNDGLTIGAPANCAGVVAVTGLRHIGTKVGFSDLGPAATIAAPAGNCVNASGVCQFPLLTTSNSGTAGPVASIYTDDTSHLSIGTSFSAPLVAGTVALMLSANKDLTPAQVISALKSTARAFPTSGAAAGTPMCQAPSSTAQTDECYCTTSTCGAGMLDAHAAVASVAALTANIYTTTSAPVADTPVALDASGSIAPSGAIVSYQWAVTGGSATASFTSATNTPTASLTATTAGTVEVTLTVTDAANQSTSNKLTLTFAAASGGGTNPGGGGTSSGGGGGGGALEPVWLIGLLAASLALRFPSAWRRIRRIPSRARRP